MLYMNLLQATNETQYEFPVGETAKVLPAGWETGVSTSSGDTYYINSLTNETQYEFPDGPCVAEATTSAASAGSAGGDSSQGLPAGWEKATSRSSGDTYYINTVTNDTRATMIPSILASWLRLIIGAGVHLG